MHMKVYPGRKAVHQSFPLGQRRLLRMRSERSRRRTAEQRYELAASHCPMPSRAPDRKDSTPRHGRLLHPSTWAERDDRDHAAENFFQGGSPKTGHPISPPGPPSAPEIVLRQISGDEAWMKI